MIANAIFLGSKKFGLELFKSLYRANSEVSWTIMCPPDSDDLRTTLDEFYNFSKAEGLDLLVAHSPSMVVQYVKDLKPDVMVVCGYYRILPVEMLGNVKYGVWGIHNSLLPKYRGGSPLVWQIINNEEELGSSFFKFASGVDDGAILDQVKIVHSDKMSIKEAMDLIEQKWVEKIPKLWEKFCDGDMVAEEQNHLNATYCAQRQEVDGLVDWSLTAVELDCFIRAQASPYPQAYFELDGKRVKIVEHEKDSRVIFGKPGQVFEVKATYVTVCCGDNAAIRLSRLGLDDSVLNASTVITSFKQRL